jgi:glycosyltransferase involved in cell wall biosynthesis
MERVAENIAIELAESRQSVEVVTSSIGHRKSFKDYELAGYTVTRLHGLMMAGLPVIPLLFLHLLRQPRGSVYHVHVAQAFIPEISLLAAWIRQGKFIAHFHLDVAPSGTFGAIFKLYKKILFPFMLRNAHSVIVFSEDQKQLVHHKYGVAARQIRILPNGIRRGFERHASRNSVHPYKLLFVGRLSQQKNIRFLLEALDGISEKFSTRIVGEGELRSELELLSKKLNLKNVTFTGRKDDEALRKEYDEADIFVLPSEREGMPLVLIDAMAMRIPAIGANVLGTKDIIQDGKTGFLVPLNNIAALQKSLLKLAESPELYSVMSQNSYEAVQELAWPRLVKRLTNEVYE